ncbi:MAG: addiction module protein [Desulfotignum sp.]|nr:addiction module protein [Desulfotignum sp.]MCF8089628.1 addiction module protein [Desulfotignum sp.]MCF8138734.1 addiction module protein [Desulfotignum sp.]
MGQEKIRREIDKLNFSEKLLLVGDIWDSIAQDAGQEPLPEWQKKELNKRYSDFRGCPIRRFPFSIFYTIEDFEIIIHSVFDNRQDPDKRP